MTRRSLSSSPDIVAGLPPTRRLGGSRKEASDRLRFVVGERSIDGWALNKSRGGIRAIVDEVIELGTALQLYIADEPTPRPSRIVWIQEEPDGAIVGVEFTDNDGRVSEPPGPLSGDAST
ncbi:MAG: PilZ domain-containing protein [Myxococcales bacterium]|nr:PilZ domain-containing protein [Myxococcales bacterium]